MLVKCIMLHLIAILLSVQYKNCIRKVLQTTGKPIKWIIYFSSVLLNVFCDKKNYIKSLINNKKKYIQHKIGF